MHTIDSHIDPIIRRVSDPEIPVLSVVDLGVVYSAYEKNNVVYIQLTPTYSGCPAMDTIADDLTLELKKEGYQTEIKLVLSPAWNTDMITIEGRNALEKYGIAPPLDAMHDKMALKGKTHQVKCPQCQSTNTKLLSAFGSTACKALCQCNDCLEPFDYFKCLKA